MSRPRLILHLGVDGTGASSIARYLAVNSRGLSEAGVQFHPLMRQPHRVAHDGAAPTIHQLTAARTARARSSAASFQFGSSGAVNSACPSVAVVTAPDFLWLTAADIGELKLRFSDFDIYPVVLLRRFSRVVDSRYARLVVDYRWTDEPSAELADHNVAGQLAMWAAASATGRVQLVDYDDLPDGDAVEAFVRSAGIPTHRKAPAATSERLGRSPSAMLVALAKTFRRQGVAEEHIRGLVQQLEGFSPVEAQSNLSQHLRAQLDHQYGELCADLAASGFVEPSEIPSVRVADGEWPLHITNISDAVFALGRAAAARSGEARTEALPEPNEAWQRVRFLERELEAATAAGNPGTAEPRPAESRTKALDFVVVGAQKAGTTALWQFLRRHPGVYMPAGKEPRFFQFNDYFARGRRWFESEYFTVDGDHPVCGMASPHCMGGTEDVGVEEIATRLAEYREDLRLVALLRDPVERAVSHYRMMVKRGAERRALDQAVSEQLTEAALVSGRRAASETNSYVVRGEYGRILSVFARRFPPEQLLIVWTSELQARPTEVARRVATFIGVQSEDMPAVGGSVFVGGTSPRVDADAASDLRGYLVDQVWPYVSRVRREEFEFFFEMWNTVPDQNRTEVLPATRRALVAHFTPDIEQLVSEFAVKPPWLAEWEVKP